MDNGLDLVKRCIRDIPDFPKPGILFRDIAPVLARPDALQVVIDRLAQRYAEMELQHILAIEARGFIFGVPLALRLRLPLQLVRKPGKLPGDVDEVSYALEYGRNTLQMHKGVLAPGDRVLIVDDLLATGGTVAAAAKLAALQGGTVVEAAFLIELAALKGRQNIPVPAFALLSL